MTTPPAPTPPADKRFLSILAWLIMLVLVASHLGAHFAHKAPGNGTLGARMVLAALLFLVMHLRRRIVRQERAERERELEGDA